MVAAGVLKPRVCLAGQVQVRWHLHFTLTSASWLNLIEGWFSVLIRNALLNNSFASVADLRSTIDVWTSAWNRDPKPFASTQTAEDIITKVQRGRAALTETATHH